MIVAPDGQPLCRTSEKKIRWYLDRNLGSIISVNPTTLRLFFEPKGRRGADHPYNTAVKKNVCVCCGSEKEITRHHVVPRCFRKHFPEELKNHALHDVLILCVVCHNKYEDAALEKKREISKKMDISIQGKHFSIDSLSHVRMAGCALMLNYDKMPVARREELLDRLRRHYGKQDITKEEIEMIGKKSRVPDPDFKSFGQMVVERLDDIETFVKDWRRHFVEVMKPQHLPPYWAVENSVFW
jgi:hypothetical protein